MLLLMNLISMTAVYYIENFYPIFQWKSRTKYTILILLPLFISIPLIGWLADAKVGNYKLFRAGTILLLIAVISSVGTSQIPYSEASSTVSIVLRIISSSLGVIGLATCMTTALQLGLDQMPDASADNITSFIAWLVFSIVVGSWAPSVVSNTVIVGCIKISPDNNIFTIYMDLIAPVYMHNHSLLYSIYLHSEMLSC